MQNRNSRNVTLSAGHLVSISALLALAVSASAQTTTPDTQPATTTAATTTAATTTAPTTQTATASSFSTTRPATTLSAAVKFNFVDVPIDTIINYLSESYGFTIIKKVKIAGRGTLTQVSPLTADEAIDRLQSILKDQTPPIGILRAGMVLRVDTLENLKKLNIRVIVTNKPEEVPPTDELVTVVIPLARVDAVRIRQDLASMFSADAEVAANAASNSLVITDRAISIWRIVKIVAAMDNQLVSISDVQVFKLKYANAGNAAKLINDIFKQDNTASPQGGPGGRGAAMMMAFGGYPGGGGPQTPTATTRGGKVTASSDDRTNTVVVTGPKETLDLIKTQIIDKLDSDPAQDTTFFVYALKNANSLNLQGVLNGFFGQSGGGSSGTSGAGTFARGTGFTAFGSAGSGGGSSGGGFGSSGGSRGTGSMGTNSSGAPPTGTTGGTGAMGSRGTSGSSSGGMTSAASDLVGQAYVVADQDTNSLLVTVKTPYRERVLELLKTLDRDIPQVLIKVLVCEVTHSNTEDLGVEWSILNQRQIKVTNPDGTTGYKTIGQSGGSDFGLAKAISTASSLGTPNGMVASIVESNVAASLRALASIGKLDVLSRPSILASDNQLASIMVGQLVPIITASDTTSVGNIVNSVTYQQVGIILNVTPHINPDGLVILDVQPQVSQLSKTDHVTLQAGVDAPVIDLRQAQSRVEIRNGQTVIIGGLMQDQKQETVDKIPLLGDIPWLGEIFKHTNTTKSKTELLIFITPQVAQSPDQLEPMSKDEQRGTQLVPNAVAPGTFDQHMQGMQRGHAPDQAPLPNLYPKPPEPATRPATQPAETGTYGPRVVEPAPSPHP